MCLVVREMAQLCKHEGLHLDPSIRTKAGKFESVTLVLARWGRGMDRIQVWRQEDPWMNELSERLSIKKK